jgi:tRNA-specific 2-thiouridylase
LYGLDQAQLARVLFPVGSMYKSEVFALAKTFHVPLSEQYRESQDLCFFPEKDPHAFLDRYLPPSLGEIIDTQGNKRGEHRGLFHFTEGQRRGLGIGGLKIPLHVVAKDPGTNTLIVGSKEEAKRSNLRAHTLRWISRAPEAGRPHRIYARIHSLGKKNLGEMQHDGKHLIFTFEKPQLGISPGQSIVFYKNEEIVGGAVIS